MHCVHVWNCQKVKVSNKYKRNVKKQEARGTQLAYNPALGISTATADLVSEEGKNKTQWKACPDHHLCPTWSCSVPWWTKSDSNTWGLNTLEASWEQHIWNTKPSPSHLQGKTPETLRHNRSGLLQWPSSQKQLQGREICQARLIRES